MSTKRSANAAIALVALAAGGWLLGRGAQRVTKEAPIAARSEEPRSPGRHADVSRALAVGASPLPVAAPGALSDARWRRGPDEWQGMLPLPFDWPCPEDGNCSMARACVQGKCVPCSVDKECVEGEICALGRCVHQELAECTSRKDCQGEERCILSETSGVAVRGNEGTRTACLSPNGPSPFPVPHAVIRGGETPPITAAERVSDLLDEQLKKGL